MLWSRRSLAREVAARCDCCTAAKADPTTATGFLAFALAAGTSSFGYLY